VAFDPERFAAVAHGYAVTIHKSQGATVDRVYTLADPGQNRNATYVALTRHRDEVHLYADRKTFKDRETLDKLLSRPGRKDLAQDYAAADLGRQAARAEVGERQANALRRQEQALKADLVTLDRAEAAKNHHRRTEIALQQAVRRVYAHPEEALRKILADPKAFDRLATGEAAVYGELRGQGRLFGKDAARISAEREIPGLRSAIWTHREAEASLGRQQSAAARVQGGPTEIKLQLDRVTAALRQVAAYARQPERALEIAVRQTSRAAVQTAVSLLPSPLQLPVRFALRAVELALGVGRDLGR
jgi:ATP-dependent exoDNAse (exonuclease V) beta subunit